MAEAREESDDEVLYNFLYTNCPVKTGTRFGPYPGDDAEEGRFKNWMQSVQRVRSKNEANLIVVEEDGKTYFEAIRFIPAEKCLFLWIDPETSHQILNNFQPDPFEHDLPANALHSSPDNNCVSETNSTECVVPDHVIMDSTDLNEPSTSQFSDNYSSFEFSVDESSVKPTPNLLFKCHLCTCRFDDSQIFISHLSTHNPSSQYCGRY